MRISKWCPRIDRFTIGQAFGNWEKANRAHFADGASFDQIFRK
ncbi:hypothetical protein [Ramlibacter lithotrophicus]|nr:hypothetical protein [Ramlibacter lithotrophicus]